MFLQCLAVSILTPQSSYTTLESILLQFPLGGIVFIFVLLTGYLSSRIPNICLIQLILCCLPVIAGCIMIWKSDWYHHAPTPVAGYTIIGFFGPVVFLIINIGMANVAGATKKSFTAAAIFVAYCVGNVSSISCTMDRDGAGLGRNPHADPSLCVDCRAPAHQNANARPALSRIVVGIDHMVNIILHQTLYPASHFASSLSLSVSLYYTQFVHTRTTELS